MRLKYVADINANALTGNEDPGLGFDYLDISAVGQGQLASDPVPMTLSEAPSRARRKVETGDTVVSTVRTYLRAVWHVDVPGDSLIVSTGFAVLSPRPTVDPRFLGWTVQSSTFIEEVVARSTGVSYPAINPEDIGDIYVPVPTPAEQRRIADYLDAETARIDEVIAKKERLAELIRTRDLGSVEQEVTDSASQTGSVPLVPLRRVCSKIIDGTHGTYERVLVGLPLLSAKNLAAGRVQISESESLISESDYQAICRSRRFQPGDILLGVIGASIGNAARLDVGDPTAFQRSVAALTASDIYNPTFLFHVTRSFSFQSQLAMLANQSAQAGVYLDTLASIRVPLPPLNVQERIARRLEDRYRRSTELVRAIKRTIALMREHRQALITAAVTGQLKIPGVAA